MPHDFFVLSRPKRPPGYVGGFGIGRFVDDWCDVFGTVCGTARLAPGLRQGVKGTC